MGCNCGSKRKKFQEAVKPPVKPTIKAPLAPPPKPLPIKLKRIIERPDSLLTPRQLSIKHRHFRILARQERIAKRNAMAQKIQQADNQVNPQQNNFPQK